MPQVTDPLYLKIEEMVLVELYRRYPPYMKMQDPYLAAKVVKAAWRGLARYGMMCSNNSLKGAAERCGASRSTFSNLDKEATIRSEKSHNR